MQKTILICSLLLISTSAVADLKSELHSVQQACEAMGGSGATKDLGEKDGLSRYEHRCTLKERVITTHPEFQGQLDLDEQNCVEAGGKGSTKDNGVQHGAARYEHRCAMPPTVITSHLEGCGGFVAGTIQPIKTLPDFCQMAGLEKSITIFDGPNQVVVACGTRQNPAMKVIAAKLVGDTLEVAEKE